MRRIIDLPAEFEQCEGLDGHWDIDNLSPEEEVILGYVTGREEVPREVAIEGLLSLIGSRLDDADLTEVNPTTRTEKA